MWAALNAALREDGWKLVLLLRMSPAIPFSVINYALGSSSLPVSLWCREGGQRDRIGRESDVSLWE